ncbi:hypothetical protein EV715DRAFT_268333 [Schizophyllum commune]
MSYDCKPSRIMFIDGWPSPWETREHPKPSCEFREEYHYDRDNRILTHDNIEDWSVATRQALWDECILYRRRASRLYPSAKDGDVIVRAGVLKGICVWERQELFVLVRRPGLSVAEFVRDAPENFWQKVAEFPCHLPLAPVAVSIVGKHAGADSRVAAFLAKHESCRKSHDVLRVCKTADIDGQPMPLGLFYMAWLLKDMYLFEKRLHI